MVWKSKVTEYDQGIFKKLYLNGESTITIGKKFNVVDATVRKYLILQDVKIRNKVEASKVAIKKGRAKIPTPKQHKIPKSPKKLTKEKACLLGVLCGDGYLTCSKGSDYQIALQSIDKEFVNEFTNCINKIYNLEAKESFIKTKNPQWSDKYQSRVCSKEIFLDLQNYHKNFKTFEWNVPKQILKSSKNIQAKFLQGFFDSDGHVNWKGKQIIGASANIGGIKGIKGLLDNQGIKSTVFQYKNRNLMGVGIYGRKNLELFTKNINFIIKRKKENLNKLMNSYKRYLMPRSEIIKQHKKMIDYRKKGLSYSKIADKLNISSHTIRSHIHKYDLK
jgi:intein-encoded DNA endonuclease-like protein